MTLDDKVLLSEEAKDLADKAHGRLAAALAFWKEPGKQAVAQMCESEAIDAAKRAAILLDSIARDERGTRLPDAMPLCERCGMVETVCECAKKTNAD